MHPVLFEIPLFGGLTIYTYGFLVATGFLAGILWIIYETRRLGEDTAKYLDLVFYIIIASIIGSRVLFLLITDPSRMFTEPWSIFMLWEGGLVFYGGVIAAMIAAIIYLRKKKLQIFPVFDIFSPALAIGHVFGRLGCLMAGCCHGRPAGDAWCGIVFPADPNSFAPSGDALYPTQLFEASGEFVIFLILILFRKHKKFDGQVFALYLLCYSILRFVNEMFRGDIDRGYIVKNYISTSQGVSIGLFAIAVAIMVWGYRKVRRENV